MEGKDKKINKLLIIVGCIIGAIFLFVGTKNIISYASKDMNEERPHGALDDVPCVAGTYKIAATGECKDCPVGYKCPFNSTSPTACLAGTYASGGAAVCTECQEGYYCPGATTRKICDAGYSCLGKGLTEMQPCPEGSFCNSSVPQGVSACPNGKWSDAGKPGATSAEQCYDCPAGYYCALGSKNKCPDGMRSDSGATLESECYCPAGTYLDGGQCETCPVNSYCLKGAKGPTACTGGKTSPEGSDAADDCACPAGTYLNGGQCTTCPKGSYCFGGSKNACSAGTYNNLTGQSSATACKTCDDGTFSSELGSISCTSCEGGTVSPDKTVCIPSSTPVSSVTISGGKTVLTVGESTTFSVVVQPSNALQTVTWSVSGSGGATISNGVLKATKVGQVVVKVASTLDPTKYSTKTVTIIDSSVSNCNSPGIFKDIEDFDNDNDKEECLTCPPGYHCNNGVKTLCDAGTFSVSGQQYCTECLYDQYQPKKGQSSCIPCLKVGDDEGTVNDAHTSCSTDKCEIKVETSSKSVSVGDEDAENSYYIVQVTVEGNVCNGQNLTLTATNAKSISPATVSNIESDKSYYFNVYPKKACSSSKATATISDGTNASIKAEVEVLNEWKTKTGCYDETVVAGHPIGPHHADNEALDHYYANYDLSKKCYTIYAERSECGPSAPSTPTDPENPSNPTVEQDACYMNNATGIYTWGKYKNDSNYTLMPDLDTRDKCNIPPEGGTGNNDPVYACYKDANNNYQWAVTPPAGYTLVESIREEANCKLIDNAACYIDSNNKYVWGNYANSNSHKLVESIKTADKCVNPDACYKDKNNNYVWGNYSYNGSYSLVSNITKKEDCKKTVVNVPSTAANVSTIIYISIAIMTIAGGSFIYYVYNKKKLNAK